MTKVRAITDAPKPPKFQSLNHFWSQNYYAKFIPIWQLSMPLYKLLGRRQAWQWGRTAVSIWKSKETVDSTQPLGTIWLKTTCTCVWRISIWSGGSSVPCNRDQTERPIAMLTSLHSAECRYSQLDKEALAILFGVTNICMADILLYIVTTSH